MVKSVSPCLTYPPLRCLYISATQPIKIFEKKASIADRNVFVKIAFLTFDIWTPSARQRPSSENSISGWFTTKALTDAAALSTALLSSRRSVCQGPRWNSSWEDIFQLDNLLAITHMSCSIFSNSSFLVVVIFPPKCINKYARGGNLANL